MQYLRDLNFTSMLLRMLLAILAGGFLGLERENKGHPAGLRTYMTVCLGAATTMLLSQYLFNMLSTRWLAVSLEVGIKTDVSRFGAQVINGIGFLGAGTILVTNRQEVKGLTTAASLWACACMGIAIGAGFYECFICAFLFMFLCLSVFPKIETFFMTHSRGMLVYLEIDDVNSISTVISKLKSMGITLNHIEFNWRDEAKHPGVNLDMELPKGLRHVDIVTSLADLDQTVSIEEI